ncbi:hypothetical protein AVEN_28946-1 [Araneus ventricosus]|uniref:Uncharacterized protein n=1 Tax=Araneus ventricosus TaxID=182803 RepID=A0A4Y2AJG8_ARAVE|nr:hypothetical protein AVEN_28946-1 [Araneus ventricosus]
MLFRTLSPTTVPNFKTTPFFFSIRRFLAFVDWTNRGCCMRERMLAAQSRLIANVWPGIVRENFKVSCLFVWGCEYLILLQQVLPELFEKHTSQSLCRSLYFQHDGAPAHFTNKPRPHRNVTFVQIWITDLLDRRTYRVLTSFPVVI